MNCRKCGKPLQENAIFCAFCGTPILNQTSQILTRQVSISFLRKLIPGFYTMKAWKIVIACIYYSVSLLVLIPSFGLGLFMLAIPFGIFHLVRLIGNYNQRSFSLVSLLMSFLVSFISLIILATSAVHQPQDSTLATSRTSSTKTSIIESSAALIPTPAPVPTPTPVLTPTPVPTPTPKPTPTQKPTPTPIATLDPDEREAGGFDILTKGGMNGYQADNYITVAKQCGLDEPTLVLNLGTNKKKVQTFSITTNDGDFSIIIFAEYTGIKLVNLKDKDGLYMIKNGVQNKSYVYHHDIDRGFLQINVEDTIKQILKAPSTAKFPGGFFNPFDDWGFGIKKGIIYITSYVDSENSFGAMLRSQFQVGYKYDNKTQVYTLVYLWFDNQTVLDARSKNEK